MSEVSTSRRAVMRALAILPAAIVTQPAAHAAVELVSSPVSDGRWAKLLADERRAASAYDELVNAEDAAYDRFYSARDAADAKWQARWDEKAGKPYIFIDARPAHEQGDERATAGIHDHNAFCEAMRKERDAMEAPLLKQSWLTEAQAECSAARSAHIATIEAIVAYPSRDPDIIAHKLRLLIEQFGDVDGDLPRLLASITGEA